MPGRSSPDGCRCRRPAAARPRRPWILPRARPPGLARTAGSAGCPRLPRLHAGSPRRGSRTAVCRPRPAPRPGLRRWRSEAAADRSFVEVWQEVEDERVADRNGLDVQLHTAARAVELAQHLPGRVGAFVLQVDHAVLGMALADGGLFLPVLPVVPELLTAPALDHPGPIAALD